MCGRGPFFIISMLICFYYIISKSHNCCRLLSCCFHVTAYFHAAARLLVGVRKYEPITLISASLQCLPICFRVNFKILRFVFKAPRFLRSVEQLILKVPDSRFRSRGNRSFCVTGPTLWNVLPLLVRSAQSLPVLKSLKKFQNTHQFTGF